MRSRCLANSLFVSFLMVVLAGLALPGPAGADCLPYGSFPRITATYAEVHPTEMAALDERHIVGLQGSDLVILGGDALPEYETLVRLTVSASASLNQLALVGTLVYCVDRGSGAVYAIDAADPDHPVLLGVATVPSGPRLLGGNGALLGAVYGASTWALYDCADPLAPTVISTTAAPLASNDIVIRGDRALIQGNGWRLYDVSDPALPVLLGEADYPVVGRSACTVRQSAIVGDRLVLLEDDGTASGDAIYGTLFWKHSLRLKVLDCGDPGAPVVLGNDVIGVSTAYPTSISTVTSMSVSGNLVFAHGGDDPLVLVYDIGGSAATRIGGVIAGSATRGLFGSPGHLLVAGTSMSYACAYDQPPPDNVLPTQWPEYLPFYTHMGVDIATGNGWMALEYAQTTSQYETEPLSYVAIYRPDISLTVPAATMTYSYGSLDADGDRLYSVAYGRLYAADLADPAHPGAWQELSVPHGLACAGCGPDRIVAVGPTASGIQLYDLSNVASPVLLGSVPGVVPTELLWSGNLLCAATSTGVTTIDVTDPAAPVVLGEAAVGACTWLRAAGAEAIVAGAAESVAVVDLDPSGPPVARAMRPAPAPIIGVAVVDDVVYLGCGAVYACSLADLSMSGQLAPTGPLGLLANWNGELLGYGLRQMTGFFRIPLSCDGGLVAVFDFRVTMLAGGLVASWRADASADEFRVEGRRGGEFWTLPVRRDGDLLSAVEDPARCAAGGEIAYTLSAWRAGAWVPIAQQTVALETPRFSLRLLGASPNPFNPRTTVRFELSRSREITLRVFDGRGRQVRTLFTGMIAAGPHDVTWDGRDDRGSALASGPYLVQLRTQDGQSQTAKALLMK